MRVSVLAKRVSALSCLCVRIYQLGSHWTNFVKFHTWYVYEKSVEEINLVKIGQKYHPLYIEYLSAFYRHKNIAHFTLNT